jgi:uncharacterized protein YeaO (DUF488 family)
MIEKIYTSYFANIRNLPPEVVPISISQIPPAAYKGLMYKKLAPPSALISAYKKNPNEADYIRKYHEQVLSNLNQFKVLKELEAMVPAGTTQIALICYEKPGDFCHRRLIAKWLKKIGIDVPEYPTM